MATRKERINAKNEATGMRLVSQFVQEFWECGWQPFDHRNDRGIDGLIIMKKRGNELGVRVNVQVKCGDSYISSHDEDFIKFKFKSKSNLKNHINYWRHQLEPAILVLVNPSKKLGGNSKGEEIDIDFNSFEGRLNPEAWWVDLKDQNIELSTAETLIKIPKSQQFNAHSKGAIVKICKNLIPNPNYSTLSLKSENLKLIHGKIKAREFSNSWKKECSGIVYCPAIDDNVIISNTGWKHITSKHRGAERIDFSKRYLGAAKQIIEQVGGFINHPQKRLKGEFNEFKIGLIAYVETKETAPLLVQVILAGREDVTTRLRKYWFYSIHPIKAKIS